MEYELTIPFVVCASKGGPFDDDAYVAGFEMGLLAGELTVLKVTSNAPFEKMIRTANTYQADLIAMDRGWKMTALPMEGMPEVVLSEWNHVRFTPADDGPVCHG